MLFLQLLPVALSLLVLGAHFLRAGHLPLVALALALAGLLFLRRRWVARAAQAALVLGALEWGRSLLEIASRRMHEGEPVARLVVILGSVALGTALSLLAFRSDRVRRWYGLGGG